MKKVAACVRLLGEIFDSLHETDFHEIEKRIAGVSKLEHEADLTKNDIRNHLPKSLFLPIDRSHFLEILSIQDNIADKAEEIGILLSLHPLENFHDFQTDILHFFHKSEDVFLATKHIIAEIDELLESSFGGIEAEKVKTMVEQTAYKEYEAQKIQRQLMRHLFSDGKNLSAPCFYLWMRLIEEIGAISHLSERLANRIRMVLELK